MSIDASRIVEVYEALCVLTTTAGGSMGTNIYDDDDEGNVDFAIRSKRAAANKVLSAFVQDYVCVAPG